MEKMIVMWSEEQPHMNAGKFVHGTISRCCNSSVSAHYGSVKDGKWVDFHHTCNKCKKVTAIIKKPMWIITYDGKYKEI